MDTFGWDTVYVLNIDRVNEALLARRGQLLLAFDTSPGGGLPVVARGSFSDWKVVQGGSGEILYLKLTIQQGECAITLGTPRTVPLDGIALVVAVQLRILPAAPGSEELRFDIRRAGVVGSPSEPGVITPVVLQNAEGRLDPAESALLMASLAGYIAANAHQISFVFASINLVPPAVDSWLAPVRSAYVYANREGGTGALAILSVTTDRETGALPRTLDAALLSPGYDASFAVSRDMFLKHVIMPTLPRVFGHGTHAGSFAFDGSRIVNTRVIATDGVKKGAITYHPQLSSVAITTTGSGLASGYAGDCDLKAGIFMKFWVNTRNQAVFNADKTLSFRPDPDPESRHEAHVPWWWWFGGLLVKAIVDLVVKLIARGIAEQLTRDAGDRIAITRNPPTSIQWAETTALDVQFAAVSSGFYMQGQMVTTAGAARRAEVQRLLGVRMARLPEAGLEPAGTA